MSDYTQTPNHSFYLPVVDADDGAWGGHINSNTTALDTLLSTTGLTASGTFLPLRGGTMNGMLTLFSNPSGNMDAVPKQYVDTNFAPITGSGNYVAKAGDTMTGPLMIGASLAAAGTTPFLAHGNLSGQPGSATTLSNFSQIAVDADTMDAVGNGGPGGANYFYVGGVIGSGAAGHRTGIESFIYTNATPVSTDTSKFHTAIAGWSQATAPDNASQTNQIFGGNFLVELANGATGWGGLCGLEVDVNALTGSSVHYKEGMKVVIGAGDTVHGSNTDSAIGIVGESGNTTGWNVGLSYGAGNAVWAIAATGTMIGTTPTGLGGNAYGCAWGIDFNAVTFTSGAFRSPNFTIRGTGGIGFSGAASSVTDLSHHIDLYNGAVGFTYYGSNLRVLSGASSIIAFDIGGTNAGYVGGTGWNGAVAASTVTASGAITANNWLLPRYNVAGLFPPAGNGGAFGWNASGGNAEVDYINTYTSGATYSHTFWQQTGATAQTALLRIDPSGNIVAQGSIRIGGLSGVTWYSGNGPPLATAPVGSLYSRTDGPVGATLYVSRGGGTWAAVAGV
jgi:hypothetical protein